MPYRSFAIRLGQSTLTHHKGAEQYEVEDAVGAEDFSVDLRQVGLVPNDWTVELGLGPFLDLGGQVVIEVGVIPGIVLPAPPRLLLGPKVPEALLLGLFGFFHWLVFRVLALRMEENVPASVRPPESIHLVAVPQNGRSDKGQDDEDGLPEGQ